MNLSDARRLSDRRPTIGRQLFVFVSPSEATDDRFAGQQSEGIVFVVPRSNGWRQSTARQTFEPECVIVFWLRDQGPNDNQFAGRRSVEFVFVVLCSGIERRSAINSATDFRAGVHDCVLVSRSWAERQSIRRTTIKGHCVLLRALQEPINRKRALQKPIEDKRSRDTESNGGKTLSARRTCGSLRFCADAAQRPR